MMREGGVWRGGVKVWAHSGGFWSIGEIES